MEQTDGGEVKGGNGWKKVKGLAKEPTCITDRHRGQGGDGQREGLVWAR